MQLAKTKWDEITYIIMQAAEGDACVHGGGREVHPRPREGTLRLKNGCTPLKAPIELMMSCSAALMFDVAKRTEGEEAQNEATDRWKPVACFWLS